MISIGIHRGGPELKDSKVDKAIRAAAIAVAEIRGPWVRSDECESSGSSSEEETFFQEGSTPAINIIFYIPGTVMQYDDVTQITATRFTRKRKLLLVTVPVPPELIQSSRAEQFVLDALHQSIQIAADAFAKKSVEPFDLAQAETLVDKVKQSLSA